MDAIHESSTGREYILEVNGTSSGLAPDTASEDNLHIRDLVVEKMNALFCQGRGADVPQALAGGEAAVDEAGEGGAEELAAEGGATGSAPIAPSAAEREASP